MSDCCEPTRPKSGAGLTWWLVACISATVIALISVAGWWLQACLLNQWHDPGGTWSQAFGIVNVYVSGLAFLALFFTVFLQARELSSQRDAVEELKSELERSAEAQERMHRLQNSQFKALVGAGDPVFRPGKIIGDHARTGGKGRIEVVFGTVQGSAPLGPPTQRHQAGEHYRYEIFSTGGELKIYVVSASREAGFQVDAFARSHQKGETMELNQLSPCPVPFNLVFKNQGGYPRTAQVDYHDGELRIELMSEEFDTHSIDSR